MSTLSPHILTYVTLLLMRDDVNGLQITGLRRDKGGREGGDDGGPGPASTSSSNHINIPLSTSSPFPGHSALPSTSSLPTSPPSTSSPSHISSTSQISTLPSTSSPSLSHISSTGQISPTLPSTSSLPTPTSNSGVLLANSRHVALVGAVLGSVILAGLGLLALAYYRGRAGKARRQPKCFSEAQTEMSQTQNGPPLTSAAPLLYRPVPLHFFNASSRDYTPSLLPLIPADNSHDSTSHPPLSTSEYDSNFDVPSDPLQCPYDTQPFLSLDIARPEAKNASSSTSDQLLPLHHVMAGFQDGLEANHRSDTSDQSDPPPKYIG